MPWTPKWNAATYTISFSLVRGLLNAWVAERTPGASSSPSLRNMAWIIYVPGPPKEPKIIAQYPKIESKGSIGSIILAILEVQVWGFKLWFRVYSWIRTSWGTCLQRRSTGRSQGYPYSHDHPKPQQNTGRGLKNYWHYGPIFLFLI